jgi:protein-L-isoaspartate(D-aspartate) O-methyltransferase
VEFLLDEIRRESRYVSGLTDLGGIDERVLDVLRQVPRHAFVPDHLQYDAYANHPLPIGHGQTISQPYIVALMTALVRPRSEDVVLEVGTGSGYQTAVLASLVKRVYSVEIIRELADQAELRLHRLGYENVEIAHGDGHHGWPEHAPYDAIIVTAAATDIPPALIAQLKPGGILVAPVGAHAAAQELLLITKDAQGCCHQKSVLPVAFVPLTGGDAP